MMYTIDDIKQNGWLIFESITGSRAYGLDTASSDTDIRGVYILPQSELYGLYYQPQVSNESNDIVYYELKRFMELLLKNNPNIMELLSVPESCVLYRHPVMQMVQPEMFLSKLCEQTYANYAYAQIQKAYGLEKKIVNPMDGARKPVTDFCYIYNGTCGVSLQQYADEQGYQLEEFGLSAIDHLNNCYQLYHSREKIYAGIVKNEMANEVCLSSIPKGQQPVAMLYFNKDGYSAYCKQYREYQEWTSRRNPARYNSTMEHGKKYDAKNMMHVFRLLTMAKEIAIEEKIHVFRNDRDFLLAIKAGKFEYDELVQKAQTMKEELSALYQQSKLQVTPDVNQVQRTLIKIREQYYGK